MKLVILTVIIAAVTSSPLVQEKTWPWQVGKVYTYEVLSYTSVKFAESAQTGTSIKAELIISVKAAGHLQAQLIDAAYASLKSTDKDVRFEPIKNIDQVFDIFVDGGRIVSMNFPTTFSVINENVVKSFISALQVDVSTYGHVHDYPNSYDHESFQGLFKKNEFDLYGECETLYSVSPIEAGWRKELPAFASEADPIEIVKTKNYGSCTKRHAYAFGVPEGAVWQGVAKGYNEKQFIQHTSNARLLIGKQGTIYKSELDTSILASPVLHGKQKAEVKAIISAYLKSIENDNTSDLEKIKEFRTVNSVEFTLDNSWRLFAYGADSNVAKAQKVLQEISPFLQDPNHLAKNDFLIKFNVLVYLLFSMNSQQLAQLTNSIEIAKTSKNIAKNGLWIVYRDALAQSGNVRSFNEIKSWVQTKKIEGEEAARVITSIGATLPPTKEIVTDFFKFATSDEVLAQKALNNSALLAVSKLLRFSKEDQYIQETVIPYFSKQLKSAIESGETSKAQVYIVVLGNLAHPGILKAFAPYLEGTITISKYLRTQIVTSLKTLANLKDEHVRAVLYSILRNTAEPYEIRVAAALNIFLAVPTPEMIQVLAYMTKVDPSTQVRAVLTTSINFAAKLKNPRFSELAQTAQSVLPFISNEKFGYSYSTDSLIDSYTGDDDFTYFRELSFIGSENTLLPKYHRSALRFKSTFGESQITFSISDVLGVINSLGSNLFLAPNKDDSTFKFAAKKVIELLNIKQAAREPLEGAIFFEDMNQQKLITFNEQEIYFFLKDIFGGDADIGTNGVGVHYTKILRQNLVNLDFPLASGFPFTYQYSEPTLINAQGHAKLGFDGQIFAGSLETAINVTYARNIIGTVGFMDTFSEVLVGAGVINKLQVHVPAKVKASYKLGGEASAQIELLTGEDDLNLVQLNVLPYIGTQKKDSTTYKIDVIKGLEQNLYETHVKFDYFTGINYVLTGRSYSSDFKFIEKSFNDDFLTNLGNLLYQKEIAFTDINLKYLKESTTKSVTFTVFFDKFYNQKYTGELGAPTLTKHLEPNSVPRREEIVKKASAGIESADVLLLDFSAVFDGPKKVDYVFTGAYAYSFVDPKFQAAFIARGQKQVSGVFKLNKEGAKVVPLNFEEALENDIKITYGADINFGDEFSLLWEGYGERSAEYTEALKNDPTGKACLTDVSAQNFYQKNCHKMIIKAHAPDYFKSTLTYKGDAIPNWELLQVLYSFVKDDAWDEEIDFSTKTDENALEIQTRAFYLENYSNYNFTTKFGSWLIKYVEGEWYDVYAEAIYAPINAWERSRNWFTDYQYLPYCAVDNHTVRTFSGRSYDYALTSSWHVVMVDSSQFKDLVVLTSRRPSDNGQVVYVSYKSETDKYVELEIKPDSIDVKTNAAKTSEGPLTVYWDDTKNLEAPLLEYYTFPNGVQVFNLHDRHIRMVYDKQRLVIFTDEYRSTTRGICGQNSGQIGNDYLTPWGIVSSPQLYGAAFSLEGEFSDPTTVELKKQAKEQAYQPVTVFTKVLKSDADWSKLDNKTVKSSVV